MSKRTTSCRGVVSSVVATQINARTVWESLTWGQIQNSQPKVQVVIYGTTTWTSVGFPYFPTLSGYFYRC
jgi:hypothetical protein